MLINLQPMHTLDLTRQFIWLQLNSAQRMRPETHPGFKLSNKKRKKTVLRLLLKIARRSVFPKTIRIWVSKTVKISDHKTITETAKIINNGETPTLAITPTATKWRAFSAESKVTGKRIAERGSIQTSHAWTSVANLSGPRSTWPTLVHQSRLSRSRIFSSELDGTHTSSSCHHSSAYYEFVCCFNCHL